MHGIDTLGDIDERRRWFIGAAAATLSVPSLGLIGSAEARVDAPAQAPIIKPGSAMSFGAIRQIDAGVLNVGWTARPMARLSFCCMAGPTTSTASSMSPRAWPR